MANTLTNVPAPRPAEKKLWRFPFFLLIIALIALGVIAAQGLPLPAITGSAAGTPPPGGISGRAEFTLPFANYLLHAIHYGAWAVLALGMAGIAAGGTDRTIKNVGASGFDHAAGMIALMLVLLRQRPELSALPQGLAGDAVLVAGVGIFFALLSGIAAGKMKLSPHWVSWLNLLIAGGICAAIFGKVPPGGEFSPRVLVIPVIMLVVAGVLVFRLASGRCLRAFGENPELAGLSGCGRFIPFALAVGLSAIGAGISALLGIGDCFVSILPLPPASAPIWLSIILFWTSVTLPLAAIVACGTGLENHGRVSPAGLFFAGFAIPLGHAALNFANVPHRGLVILGYYALLIILGDCVQKVRRAE